MRNIRAAVLVIVLCGAVSASADNLLVKSGTEKNRLIELYTSEGCSSCPAADKWMSKLKNSVELWQDIIPVAFHVDYWDQLGWKDKLADKAFSDRHRRYRREGSISQVYTPGFVVDGREWRGFFKRKMLKPATPENVGEITLQINSSQIKANFKPEIKTRDTLVFHAAVLGFEIENEIQAGENTGKTLHHDFAVIAYGSKNVSLENNTFTTAMPMPVSKQAVGVKAIVVWVSDSKSQLPIQVVGNWL